MRDKLNHTVWITVPPTSSDKERQIKMMPAEWLPIITQGSFNEIYVMEPDTLRFLHVNSAARKNLQYSARELAQMTPLSITQSLSPDTFRQVLQPPHSHSSGKMKTNVTHIRKDGSSYPLELRLFHCLSKTAPAIIAIGNDNSARYESAMALHVSDARLRAIIASMPGLAYQLLLHTSGKTSFPYLSEGCQTLLGVSAARLRADSSLFIDMILPEDRQSYVDSMMASAEMLKPWSWEGRIRIEKWKDIKWVSIRAIPRALPSEGVQWEGVMTNITESRLKEAELKRSRAQLAELSAHVETLKEKEQTRIAREIHDDVGGNLTAIKMALALLARRLPQEENALIEKATYIDSLVDRTIEAIHRISVDLRPGILEFGIVASIDWQAKEFEKHSGIACHFNSNKREIDLHPDQAIALFRIFQETLTNIGKHSGATRVEVKLVGTNRHVKLDVSDNGKGIAATDQSKPKSFGIRGMMERVRALGGSLTISNAAGGGSVVALRIPLSTAKSQKPDFV